VSAQEEAYRPDPLAQAIANIIAADPDTYLDRFNFRSEICISCDWRHLELGPRVSLPTSLLSVPAYGGSRLLCLPASHLGCPI
jgi:hypothetical protein